MQNRAKTKIMQVINTYIVYKNGKAIPLYQCLRSAGDTEYTYYFCRFHMNGEILDGLEIIAKTDAEKLILKATE